GWCSPTRTCRRPEADRGGAAPRMGAGPGARRRWPVARRSRRSGETGRGLRIPGMVRTGGIRNRPWEVEMQLGMIGLGRMGANMARRLRRGGHAVVGFDPTPPARAALEDETVATVDSLQALVGALQPPRALWTMVPAGAPVDDTITALAEAGIAYLDVGTSGGVWGLAEGYSLMVGGDAEPAARLAPVFATLAPAADRGWAHVGPSGAGHFAKMVHNGIEYGMMQAYAEGFAILERRSDLVPDIAGLAELWRHGSVVRSWLLDLTAE